MQDDDAAGGNAGGGARETEADVAAEGRTTTTRDGRGMTSSHTGGHGGIPGFLMHIHKKRKLREVAVPNTPRQFPTRMCRLRRFLLADKARMGGVADVREVVAWRRAGWWDKSHRTLERARHAKPGSFKERGKENEAAINRGLSPAKLLGPNI